MAQRRNWQLRCASDAGGKTHAHRHVSVRPSHEAYTVRRLYLGALRLGPLTDRWLPPCWPGASASHRTPPRRGRRSHDARWSDDWRRATQEDRRRRGFTRPSWQCLATSVPASAARAARAAVRQSAGTTQRPAADSRWPCVRVSCGAGAGWPGARPRIRVRAGIRFWPHASRYWLSQTVQTALRPSGCSS